MVAVLDGLDGLECKVGWFESAHYKEGPAVAYVATIHEFGTPHIPARPFMRPAVADHGQEWLQTIADGARAAVQGTMSAENVLELVGMQAAGNVAEKIQAVTSPPLSSVTIARKGHAKPLVDTGQMIQSVTHRVGRT